MNDLIVSCGLKKPTIWLRKSGATKKLGVVQAKVEHVNRALNALDNGVI